MPEFLAPRLIRSLVAICALAGLSACAVPQQQSLGHIRQASTLNDPMPGPDQAARNFITVAQRMEPVIEEECRNRTSGSGRNCDYQIMVDDRADQDPNAFQTVDQLGRPVVAFNLALIAQAQNQDELAFVMGHEAAHHIAGHLQSKEKDAQTGAMLLGSLAAASGAGADMVAQAQNLGAEMGSRTFSKDYELEADRLGTIITYDAGYDPLLGARFFTRIPDPGDVFLGTHPANALRLDVVRQTMAQLQGGV
ncbi:peptidase M48 [Thioclava sp. SK-1]|uniref:M48 family metallopeptidase n=1 Tax=Thioclava sp. SK-1 TaxID=1889770 RepID=UPI000825FE12|nr:M48 family metallopeptidase [Thioclava sp. SK-1]OCX66926.1 peptidase M48 [Thioclava sp. SK-1]